MPDLETRLRALGPAAFPAAPDLAPAVAARAAAPPGSSKRRAGRRLRRGLALALGLLAATAAGAVAVPGARHGVLEWLGLRHVEVRRVPRLPAATARLDLGARVAGVAAASARAGFAVRVPEALGAPDAVHVDADGRVALAYRPRPGLPRDPRTGLGLLVIELRADTDLALLAKTAGPGTAVRSVDVAGAPGAFLSGAPHAILLAPPGGGGLREERLRTAGNALVWEAGGLVLRLEGAVGLVRALAIARSTGR